MQNQSFLASFEILGQIEKMLEQIELEDFCRKSEVLNGSTIGQHTRHTLEFYLCLEKGFNEGIINYDKRNHDKQMENDKNLAILLINQIKTFIAEHQEDRELELEFNYEQDSEKSNIISTSYFRELVYNVEHAVHHMAMIKIGVREIAPYVVLPKHFGIAASTVRYNNA